MSVVQDPAHELDVAQARRWMNERCAQVIDLRERHERDAGHIPDDRYLDIGHVVSEADSIAGGRPVIFYCRSGVRSGMTAATFRSACWDAYNLSGGLLSCVDAGQPLDPAEGTVAEH